MPPNAQSICLKYISKNDLFFLTKTLTRWLLGLHFIINPENATVSTCIYVLVLESRRVFGYGCLQMKPNRNL